VGSEERTNRVAEIFAEHGPVIRAIIRRHTRDPDEQDEMFQNLYLALIRSAKPCPTTNVLGYLDKVIRHDVIDAVRRRRRYEEALTRYADGLSARSASDPEEAAIRQEQWQQIWRYIESLPDHEATAVIERLAHDRTTGETAAQMQIKERSVSRYLSAGLTRLRKTLGKREIEHGACR
jgi:RNA polymerase sigma factor (sigma-70 family)